MKRFILGFLLGVALLLGYWAWPFAGLHALAVDLQTRDSVALDNDVDFGHVRRSLSEQIITAYLRITGRAASVSIFGSGVASALGASIADPLVSQIINAENFIALLNGQPVPTEFGQVSFDIGQLPSSSLYAAWRAWRGTEYELDHFSIWLPVDAEPARQFRLRLQLIQWHWKLTGIDIPQTLRDRLGRELAKKFP